MECGQLIETREIYFLKNHIQNVVENYPRPFSKTSKFNISASMV